METETEEEVAKSRRVSSWKINIKNQYIGDFPDGLDCKESACNAGDLGSIPGSGKSPGEGNGYPLQYSCLENLRQEAWTEEPGGLSSMRSQKS